MSKCLGSLKLRSDPQLSCTETSYPVLPTQLLSTTEKVITEKGLWGIFYFGFGNV